jgi:membrane protein required for colicin V production
MAGFDWIIAAILVVSILVGIFRGFIKESLSLISWILAIWLAKNCYSEAGAYIHQYINIPAPTFREWTGFALVFVSTLFIFSVISYVIIKIFVRGPIKGVDRTLGLGLGALRGAVIVVIVLVVARGFGLETADWWQNSLHIGKFEPFIPIVDELFPGSGLTPDDENPDFIQKAADQALEALTEPEVE